MAAGLAYLCRNSVGVAESAIRDELGLTLEQSGWFMGAFFWSYAIFQVPSGWFAERLGTRIALSIFALGWSAAMLGISIAPGFWLLIVAQLTMGIAQAGLFPAACNSIGYWMPLSQRSLACGIVAAGLQVGAIAASGLTSVLLAPLGWRLVFAAFALPGFLWTVGFFIRFRDDPADVLPPDSDELALIRSGRSTDNVKLQSDTGELSELLAIASNPNMWWLCGQQVCRAAGYMFFASWFPTFLQKTRGISVENSGYLQGVVLGGALLGAIFGGLLTDWIWRRTGSLRISRSGVGAASLAILLSRDSGRLVCREHRGCGISVGGRCFLRGVCRTLCFCYHDRYRRPRVPQVSGMMNMSGNLAAASLPGHRGAGSFSGPRTGISSCCCSPASSSPVQFAGCS